MTFNTYTNVAIANDMRDEGVFRNNTSTVMTAYSTAGASGTSFDTDVIFGLPY